MRKSTGAALCLCALLVGCATAPPSRPGVENAKHSITVSGPLSNDEAARIALLNNAGFLEVAADNGISQAQLIQAKQLPNPTLSILFPLGPKQLEFAAKYPLEALWLRPRKVAAAQLDAAKVEKLVSQSGLDLVRDVKLACAELRYANRQVMLANQTSALLDEIANLADARLRAGDIGELDVEILRNEAISARSEAIGLPLQATAAREKLRHLLGQPIHSGALTLRSAPALPASLPSERALLKQALATRPDLRAAEIAIESAGERALLADSEIVTITAILDANGNPFEAGPGVDFSLPLLNRNEGGKALAMAQLRKATRHYATVRDAIAAEVRQARLSYLQAQQVVASVRDDLLPTLENAVAQSRQAFDAGNVSYLAESQIDADGAINLAQIRLDAAGQALTRANTLLGDKVGSRKAVEEATALRDLANQESETAKSRRALLGPPLLLTTTPATVWIKVPVHVGGLHDLDLQGEAALVPLNGQPGSTKRSATPVSAPPSAQPVTATVDLFYQVDNKESSLRPGQKVGIRIPVQGEAESLVAPWAAVLYDFNGGAWIYVQTAPLTYSRYRVQVQRVVGDLAVLATGPAPGALAVTDGAAELFGTEFGVPK